jgi:type II secretory pathway pseudopilin PulG
MGQQQLLLLVLGIVIVGIAAVAGIQAFSEGKAKATTDAAVSDATRVIADLQAWYLKPAAFGGGGEDVASFENVKWSAVGINPAADAGTDNAIYETINACLTLTGAATGASVKIQPRVKSGATWSCGAEIATAVVSSASPTNGIAWTYAAGS